MFEGRAIIYSMLNVRAYDWISMSAAAFVAEYGLEGFKTAFSSKLPSFKSPYTSSVDIWKNKGLSARKTILLFIMSSRFLTPSIFDWINLLQDSKS